MPDRLVFGEGNAGGVPAHRATSTREPISGRLQLWGGIECTVARTGARYRDQVLETGHRDRPEDIDRIAELGIRVLRYPVVWETISPDRADRSIFHWHDARLDRLCGHGIEPIAGLVHHGSGPRYTDLLDPEFPRLVARHAARVARRYSWIRYYTPLNEPLTTARFSCLYGHWYPHRRDYGAFLTALVAQCRATLLAMRAIRREVPNASLVQTEDFGRVFSTPALAYQAEHENERRWLTYDLLFGRVDRQHPWWRILRDHGIPERHLAELGEGEARPDIVGINHYLTSDRFLDDRTGLYPAHFIGGNGSDAYADVEAVRVPLPEDSLGVAARLREVWERYGAPLVISEVHHGCTRDEQLRWLHEVWHAARNLRREGADIRAVTIWSLLGTMDWNSLLTRVDGIYEPGAFDVRGRTPRPTALAKAAASLARTGDFHHPALDVPGWWRREERFFEGSHPAPALAKTATARSILITGPDGPERRAFLRIGARRGLSCRTLESCASPKSRAEAARLLRSGACWAVLDLPERARTSAQAAANPELAAICGHYGRPYCLLTFEGVFDGRLGRPATEDDVPTRSDEPGRAALLREAGVLDACASALAVRTGAPFGPWDQDDYVAPLLQALGHGLPSVFEPDVRSFSYLPDLAHVVLDLIIDEDTGIRHLPSGSARAADLASMLAVRVGAPPFPVPSDEGLCLALDTARGVLMPPLPGALDRYLSEGGLSFGGWRPPPRIAAE